jgi:hypothetical protein
VLGEPVRRNEHVLGVAVHAHLTLPSASQSVRA